MMHVNILFYLQIGWQYHNTDLVNGLVQPVNGTLIAYEHKELHA